MTLKFIPPAEPTSVDLPPVGPGWQHEVKFDGYRAQFLIENGAVTVYSRRAVNWTSDYPALVDAARRLACSSAIIDGEVILPDARGAPDFHNLRSAITRRNPALTFVAFDLMHLDGEDLRQRPIEERRARLLDLLPTAGASNLVFSEALEADGPQAFAIVESAGLEGIVSKKKGSIYVSGSRAPWRKVKCFTTGVFEVIGFERSTTGVPVALLATIGSAGEVMYAGAAAVTLTAAERNQFWRFVDANKVDVPPLQGMRRKAAAQWVSPGLRVTVKHLKGGRLLRHATLSGVVDE